MSFASYRRNVKRRVTGPYFGTCLPSALEQISPHHGYHHSMYRFYLEWNKWWGTLPYQDRRRGVYNEEYQEMIDKLVKPLGGLACEDLLFSRATTARGFVRVVKPLLAEGYGVLADIRYTTNQKYLAHSVGILPTKETGYVTLVSNHIPKCLEGVVSLHQVGERIAIGEDVHKPDYPFSDSNIWAIPAAT